MTNGFAFYFIEGHNDLTIAIHDIKRRRKMKCFISYCDQFKIIDWKVPVIRRILILIYPVVVLISFHISQCVEVIWVMTSPFQNKMVKSWFCFKRSVTFSMPARWWRWGCQPEAKCSSGRSIDRLTIFFLVNKIFLFILNYLQERSSRCKNSLSSGFSILG